MPHSPRYLNYLKSDAWKRKRAGAILRARGRCQACDRSATLEVHHISYTRLGCELPSDLIALCPGCHEAADEIRREGKK